MLCHFTFSKLHTYQHSNATLFSHLIFLTTGSEQVSKPRLFNPRVTNDNTYNLNIIIVAIVMHLRGR